MGKMTADRIPAYAISELSDYVDSRLGMTFPQAKWDELGEKASRASAELGFRDVSAFIRWVLSSPTGERQLESLVDCLTVGETYFFREERSFRALDDIVFPQIIQAHARADRRLRIWSAGCSTGEEAYSIAINVSANPGFKDWSVFILGTDINAKSIRKARAGQYSEWSFRGVSPRIRERYFVRSSPRLSEICPEIRRMVNFSCLNLIDGAYPAVVNNTSSIDLVICRNVLMYFTPDHAREVVRKFRESLLSGGWLLVSPVELSMVDEAFFRPTRVEGAVLHRKEPAAQAAPPAEPPPAAPLPAQSAEKKADEPSYSKAMELYAGADYDEAIAMLGRLAEGPEADARVFKSLSRSYADKGMLAEAEKWCLRAIAEDKTDAASHYLMALVLMELDRHEEAASALRRAIFLEPDFVMAHLSLANLCRNGSGRGEYHRHLRNASLALEHAPPQALVPESSGLSAENMKDMIKTLREDGRQDGQRRNG